MLPILASLLPVGVIIMWADAWGILSLLYTLILVLCSVNRKIALFADQTDVVLTTVLLPVLMMCIGVMTRWSNWSGFWGISVLVLGSVLALASFGFACSANGGFVKGILAFPAKVVLSLFVLVMAGMTFAFAWKTKEHLERREYAAAVGSAAMAVGTGVGVAGFWKFIKRLMPGKA